MNERGFVIPSTVHLRALVFAPGTRKAQDADTVVLSSLSHDGALVVGAVDPTFTRVGVGDYRLDLATAGLSAGIYKAIVTVSDGPERVLVLRETFVLLAA